MAAWELVSEWTSEVVLKPASVVTLNETSAVRSEVTREATLDGVPAVKLSLTTAVTSENTCAWNSELEKTWEETLDGTTEVAPSLAEGVALGKAWVWTSELDEMSDVRLTGLLELTVEESWVVNSDRSTEGALELEVKVFTAEGTDVLTWTGNSEDSGEGTS